MAQLNSRGTLIRSRWDYFEHSNGISFVSGSVPSGPIGCYFANNSTGATAIDVYTINWDASITALFAISIIQPPFILVPVTPTESNIIALAPDVATPPGINGMYSTGSTAGRTLIRYSQTSSGVQSSPIMGSYFMTLPPGWGLTIGGPGTTGPCELSMTVWYQYVLDNVAPAV